MMRTLRDISNKILKEINITMQMKIMFCIISSTIPFIIIMNMSINFKVEETINIQTTKQIMNILTQLNKTIDNNINRNIVSIEAFYAGGEINSWVTNDVENYKTNESYLSFIKEHIMNLKSINKDIIDIRFFIGKDDVPQNDTSVFSMNELESYDWMKDILKADNNSYYWTNASDSTWNKFSYRKAIYGYKPLYNQISNELLGVMRVDIDADSIFVGINDIKLSDSGIIFIAKDNGNLVYRNDGKDTDAIDYREKMKKVIAQQQREGSFITKIDNHEQFLVYSNNNVLNWYIIGSVPLDELYQDSNEIKSFLLFMVIIICITAILVSILYSMLLTKRLRVIAKAIRAFGKGDLNIIISQKGSDEISEIAHNFNSMARRINELMIKISKQHNREIKLEKEKYELQVSHKEAELRALQTQINPHFLYNTLEMIKGLLFSDNPKNNIIKTTQALSDMFRYNLNNQYMVKVSEEIKYLEDYMTIQNYRFDNSVYLINEIENQVLNTNIVRFTFQPIIENAILHGMRNIDRDGHIWLESKIQEKDVIISIIDGGEGIELEKLNRLREKLKSRVSLKENRRGGIGISNVNDRLKNYFGESYGIGVFSELGSGTTVTIRIPRNGR